MRKYRITESKLRRIIQEAVKGAWNNGPKRELEDAVDNLMGVMAGFTESQFGDVITQEELDDLYRKLSAVSTKIKKSYAYGPYEGEPYHFGY